MRTCAGLTGPYDNDPNITPFTTQVGTDIFLKQNRPALLVSSTSWYILDHLIACHHNLHQLLLLSLCLFSVLELLRKIWLSCIEISEAKLVQPHLLHLKLTTISRMDNDEHVL